MLIYSHTTPEILVASFRTKEQVKNSSYCDLVDDNLPDDLSTLKGDNLIIKEGTNTLNLDIALAIAFNEIRSPSSAIQFGKILIVNGPNIDTRTLLYYTRRINSGPFGSDVSQFFENHFNYITGDYKGNSIDFQQNLGRNFEVVTTDSSNGELYDGLGSESTKPFKITQNSIDQDLINTLKRLLLNCLTANSLSPY